MIDRKDLYDIHYALVLIRSDICNPINTKVLFQIINVLEARDNAEDNQIRRGISSIEGIDDERWGFAFHYNYYVIHQVLKNENVYILLITLLQQLSAVLEQGEYDKAYDLVDSFHCLPQLLAENNFMIPKSFWKRFYKNYRKMFERDLLQDK